MKSSLPHDASDGDAFRARRRASRSGRSKGRWEFTSSGRLFMIGATDDARRLAYRAANGEMRVLPV